MMIIFVYSDMGEAGKDEETINHSILTDGVCLIFLIID
jgi:hypothetical protein